MAESGNPCGCAESIALRARVADFEQEQLAGAPMRCLVCRRSTEEVVELLKSQASVTELESQLAEARGLAIEAAERLVLDGGAAVLRADKAEAKIKAIGEAIREEARAQLQPGDELPEAEAFITGLLEAHRKAST